MTAVKICGLRDRPGLDASLDAGADWVGFVFFSRSPRAVDADAAAPLAAAARGRAGRVGLFVRPDPAAVEAVLSRVELDVLQVYDEPDRSAALRARFGLPVWLARGVSDVAELPASCPVDGLLIEGKPPPGSDRPGGNGARLDWTITAGWRAPSPWLLAGGLTPGNVGAAIAASGAPGVDVSSGVETAPGIKDPALIRAFLTAVRGSG